MATLLYRIGSTAYRRWPIFLLAWIVLFAGVAFFASAKSEPMSDEFSIPGVESVETQDTQRELFPDQPDASAPSVTVVVSAPEGERLDDPSNADQVATLVEELGRVPDIAAPPVGPVEAAAALAQAGADGVDQAEQAAQDSGQPFDRSAAEAEAERSLEASSPLSEDGRVGMIDFAYDLDQADIGDDQRDPVTDAMDQARDAGLTVEAYGTGTMAEPEEGHAAELIGIGVALLVLALTFGSLVAAGLPIITAGVGVGLGVTGITAATAFMDVQSSTPGLATMLGLAVGIDYALFILARFRDELDTTDNKAHAMGIAVGTAGSAVVFAGLTVIIALAALGVVGIPFLTAMGIGAAVTVAIAVLVALTLLPAVLGLFKGFAFGLRFLPRRKIGRDGVGVRWARVLGRTPVMWVLVSVIGLGALSIPMTNLHLALPTDSTAPTDTSPRKASDMVSDAFGPGRLAPMLVVVDGRDVPPQEQATAYQQVTDWAEGYDGVHTALVTSTSESGAMILLQPDTGPNDTETEDLLADLRDGEGTIQDETGTTLGITGLTPIQVDVSTRLGDALVPYLAVVIGLAMVLLVLVFRSIWVPVTATLGFLLSVLATLGVTVAIFQEGTFGWFSGSPIVSFIPIFMIGVVFGLAMDYQVFLVTRIREAYVHGRSPAEAVVDGFRNSGKVVTAAALIMISVFAGFILVPDDIVKSMGFALAFAVLFDAFVVRMCLIPALLYLLGEKAWWLPRWLDRILPNVDIEGERLQRTNKAVEEHLEPQG